MNENIYTDLIMEHGLDSPYKRPLENESVCALGHNPSCGDKITLHIVMEDDIIKDMSFTGDGCAISQGSTSIMIQTLLGKDIKSAKAIISSFLNLIKREKLTDEQLSSLHDAVAFENISTMPARVKCATLSWHTLLDILENIENGSKA